ncbi:MAG: GIY-YIG nuclease family protein [Flavobacteriaceae bacterium]|nr:GIY-YIG nuclease family protein [Flavobacteriaceae bacterium]
MGEVITTHLIEGTPNGIRSIQISNRNIMTFVIPRADLTKAKKLDELKTSCLYILFEESSSIKPKAYIGETDNFIDRVYEHNQKKDFWETAVVFISQANSINKTEVLYLEYLAIEKGLKINRFDLSENKQKPKKPNVQRHIKDSVEGFFRDVIYVTDFINLPIFKDSVNIKKSNKLFYTNYRSSEAIGYYDGSGFTILKDSIISKDTVPSFGWKTKREKIIEQTAKTVDNKLVLTQDYTFKSPSTAADFCIGSSNNGWLVWKNKEGKTLDEIYRQQE